jgi:hypothetical protein
MFPLFKILQITAKTGLGEGCLIASTEIAAA